ncbi:MAG: DUF4160 domain-containing protein [Rhodocyclaceae bacterium]
MLGFISGCRLAGGQNCFDRVEMPTVLRVGPYRFFFFASDRGEPAHIHVEREDSIAKFWLDPVRLNSSGGLSRAEIRQIEKLVSKYQSELLEAWNDYFRG